MRWFTILGFGVGISLCANAQAQPYPIFELTDAQLAHLDVTDGSAEDWRALGLAPSLTAADFHVDTGVGEGAPYNPADMDYRIWLGWNGSTGRIYFAMERTDDIYISDSRADLPGLHDPLVALRIDGDHSGGKFAVFDRPEWDAAERQLNTHRTAQEYTLLADTAPEAFLSLNGGSALWTTQAPYAAGSGISQATAPTTTVIECYITPFDDLRWNDEQTSQPSKLYAGKTIGLEIDVLDFDSTPGAIHAFHRLSGNVLSWKNADEFADAILLASPLLPTSINAISWAQIKASLADQ